MGNISFDCYGLYLYCVIKAEAAPKINDLDVKGIDGFNHLFLVTHGEICGVVSQVPLAEFGEKVLEENLKKMNWLENKALLHEHILEQVMSVTTIIPMRFCTIYKNREAVVTVLAENRNRFYTALKQLTGKAEWGVKIFLDSEVLAREIVHISDKLQKLDRKIKTLSAGKAFFLKKQMDSLTEEEVDAKAFSYADKCYVRLRGMVERACLNQLLTKEMTGNPKEMILNSVYLVEEARVGDFLQEVNLLQEEFGPFGLEFAVSGPWPAYHFCWADQDTTDQGEDGRDQDGGVS